MTIVRWPGLCDSNETTSDIFWDDRLTLNTTNPNLTPCFQQTVLVWAPCGLLWLLLPFYTCYIRSVTVQRRTKWSKLYVFKQLSSTVLCLLAIVKLIKDILDHTSGQQVSVATYLADGIEIVTYILSFVFVRWEFVRGVSASGVFFIFWLLEIVANIPAFKWYIDLMTGQLETHDRDVLEVVLFYVKYVFILLQFIYNLFADPMSEQEKEIDEERKPLLSGTTDTREESTVDVIKRKPCPEARASFLSIITHWWMSGLFLKGYRGTIVFDELPDLLPQDKCKSIIPVYLKSFFKHVLHKPASGRSEDKSKNQTPERGPEEHMVDEQIVDTTTNERKKETTSASIGLSLLIPLLKVGFNPFVISAFVRLLLTVTTFLNPQLLGLVIGFVTGGDPFVWKGYFLAVVLLVNNFINAILFQLSFKYTYNFAMRTRTCITAAVYRKALKLSHSAKRQVTVGEIVNLMSVDAQKIHDASITIHETWALFLWVALAMYFLWQELGPSSLAGLGILCIIAPFNGAYITKRYTTLQRAQMKQKDTRIKLISQILSGIKVLKLYAWEESFATQVDTVRDAEMEIVRKQQNLRTMVTVCWTAAPYIVTLAVFGTYVLQPGNILDPTKAFVSLNLISTLNFSMAFLPMFVVFASQAYISLNRIVKFLASEEIDPGNVSHDASFDSAIMIKDGTFTWGEDVPSCLKDVNIKVKPGQLVAVVGQVGCGKSSLISAILGEMEKQNGFVNVNGSRAYVAQQAWIQNTTLKNNVLFGKEENEDKYNRIIEACALKPDLKILPGGDATEIGEKGINLSGGQKQRVNLARAVYQDRDIYLMDDPLSAVDAHVGKHLFEQVIGPNGLLRHKTRVLATHGITYLPQMDCIITIKDGRVSEMGTYDELIKQNGAFAEFINTYLKDNSSSETEEDEEKVAVKRQRSSSGSSNPEQVKRQLSRRKSSLAKSVSKEETAAKPSKKATLIEDESAEAGSIKLSVIKSYVKSAGLVHAAWMSIFFILYAGSLIGSNIWLGVWSDDSAKNATVAQSLTGLRLGVYAAFGAVLVSSIVGLTLSVLYGGIRASKIIHRGLLTRIMRAPMSFFDTTPLGRVTNRFSTDMDKVDDIIPIYICNWVTMLAPVISVFVIISYSTPIFLVVTLPIILLFIITQRVYIVTARQLKRIDSIRRSPIYINFDETLNGLSCIRAFEQQTRFIQKNERLVDNSQVAWYPVFVAQRWVGFNLNLFGSIILFFASLFAVLERDIITGGLAGLSISYASQANMAFSQLVRSSADLETYIVCVERIKEYSEITTEAPWTVEGNRPAVNWPQDGQVQFKDYSTRYRPGLDLVLHNVNFEVNAAEKIGIVGRTGAGKSSMASSLFRLIEAAGGTIYIDKKDISKIGLHDLRGRLTIIPQDPMLFSGSIRMNLDPFNKHTDEEVWRALELSHLKSFVAELSEGLEYECGEDGEALSVGQRQLVCLARALLRKSKILLLDEATAAVDLETDDLIQTTIRTEFKDCTILTIAHRLNTIMDYDRVMVLDAGRIKEFDTPSALLKRKESMFYSMAKDAGIVSRQQENEVAI